MVENKTANNLSNVDKVEIIGLFGNRNIEINLKKQVNIFIGTNGCGKTIALKLLYLTLTRQFDKLSRIDFEKIVITFKNKNVFEITPKKIPKLKGNFVVKDTAISVDTTHKFFIKNQARKFKSFDECIRNLENDIFNVEDSLIWATEQLERKTKKVTKKEVKFWENKVEEKKKFLENFEKNISTEGTLF